MSMSIVSTRRSSRRVKPNYEVGDVVQFTYQSVRLQGRLLSKVEPDTKDKNNDLLRLTNNARPSNSCSKWTVEVPEDSWVGKVSEKSLGAVIQKAVDLRSGGEYCNIAGRLDKDDDDDKEIRRNSTSSIINSDKDITLRVAGTKNVSSPTTSVTSASTRSKDSSINADTTTCKKRVRFTDAVLNKCDKKATNIKPKRSKTTSSANTSRALRSQRRQGLWEDPKAVTSTNKKQKTSHTTNEKVLKKGDEEIVRIPMKTGVLVLHRGKARRWAEFIRKV